MATSIASKWHHLIPHLSIPVFTGPMAGAAGGALAGQVSRAGGMGFIGAGTMTADQIASELRTATDITQDSKSSIGVGFLVWRFKNYEKSQRQASSAPESAHTDQPETTKRIDAALQGGAKAIWLAFGEPQDLVYWGKVVRARSETLKMPKEGRLALFISAGSETEARAILEDTDADVLVAQGVEAGGHGLGVSPPIASLLSTVHELFRDLPKDREPPLLLAGGGLSDGVSLAKLLGAGADAGLFGTRFLLTPECTYSEAQKQILERACGQDASKVTKRSMAFDEARNTLGWPAQVDGRGVNNETVREYEKGDLSMEDRQKRYKQAEKEGDIDRLVVWSGTGIERMDRETSRMPTYDTVKLIWEQAQQAMAAGGAPKL